MDGVVSALRKLASPENFKKKYGATDDHGVILFPVAGLGEGVTERQVE